MYGQKTTVFFQLQRRQRVSRAVHRRDVVLPVTVPVPVHQWRGGGQSVCPRFVDLGPRAGGLGVHFVGWGLPVAAVLVRPIADKIGVLFVRLVLVHGL